MTCACRDKINAQLAKHNTRITPVFSLSEQGIGMPWSIQTEQLEKGRGKPKAMALFASYCPFCGVRLSTKDGGA